MEIIVSDLIEKLSGRLWSGCGYVVKTRELTNGKHKHFSSRIVPPQLACYDPLHWKFIRTIATLAVEHDEAYITDIRISVRELAAAAYDAHNYKPAGWTRAAYKPWIKRVALTLRKDLKQDIRPSTRLNAQQTLRVIDFLEAVDESKIELKSDN